MDIQSTSVTARANSEGTAPSASASVGGADYHTFLKMLTVQMQNQNPLNPIESSDYAVQLATFSQVEQQTRTNELLKSMSDQFAIMGMSQLAGWVGQEARVSADLWFEGNPVTLSPNPLASADRAVMVVRDAQGNLIAREDLPVESTPFKWDGRDASGAPLTQGRYKITLESWRGAEVVREDPLEYYGRVTEARGSSAGAMLVLNGNIEVPSSSITALRMAEN